MAKIYEIQPYGKYNSSLYGNKNAGNKKKPMAKVAGTAAAAGAVLYMAKKGKLNPKEGGNKAVESIKSVLKKGTDVVFETSGKLKDKISLGIRKHPKTASIAERISSAVKSGKDYVTANLGGKVETLKDAAESKVNGIKYNADLADMAEKSAETFNNFIK